jgi:hypothetical protein
MEGILGRIVAIVLGLLALAAVGYAAYNGFSNSKASDVATGVTTIVENARAQFTQSATGYTKFTTANVASLNTAGILPSTWWNGANAVDPWGNTVAFAAGAGGTSQGAITFGGGGSETQSQCVNVAQNLKDYVTLKVGTATFTTAVPADPVTAAAACTGAVAFVLTFN